MFAGATTMATYFNGYAFCAAGTSARAMDRIMDAALVAVSIFAILPLFVELIIA